MQSIRALVRHPQFRTGAQEMSGVSLGIGAWGLVTGVAMVKSGLSVPLALFMSLVVFAGSAQLAAVPLMAVGAPMWVIWATALCVNLRFVIFSAQWRPFFKRFPLRQRLLLGYFTADLNYVLFMKREKSAYLGMRFDFLYSIYVIFAVAVIVKHVRIAWFAWRGTGPPEQNVVADEDRV